ncbi:hypothetical protein [Caulobacter sp. RL271]|jgi:hypothetical protein|uniref:Lipoprotein n=1 Tax=Caulobacter segnis TaxID=88688 RepID=A0ABY4ZRU2_9CAUL|nr:hypothetical protein [Caulobacter segnis]USQ95385.1 hypothetical protein MZV50_23010 [Caulobacter segnis]
MIAILSAALTAVAASACSKPRSCADYGPADRKRLVEEAYSRTFKKPVAGELSIVSEAKQAQSWLIGFKSADAPRSFAILSCETGQVEFSRDRGPA